ncbi:MAG: DNA polymerase III subunit gamma/tau [Oscillospiraceae bacterium]|nr:DNA polymerase III subunit gamma/tau [Oscillospiraceae bacterium]
MYQALYRKYRPKTFDDVVGQAHITRTLQNEVKTGKTAHAYLFTGSRGTGKTTCSKILAKAVNCPNAQDGNPCGECEICRGIDAGTIMDVMEIDAASNNGVDNIRQLREDAYFAPGQAKYRVYIIDETHMLSTGAFNALLKIMEEPPPHVLFILATTEVHKVPATILSRCQRFDFRRIGSEDIAGYLEKIAQNEGVELEHSAGLLIGKLADGGMRDAISLLDLCISYGGAVTAAVVAQAAGLAGNGHLLALSQAFADRNTASALEQIGQLHEKSMDMERLCSDLIAFYRDLMLLKTVEQPQRLIVALPEEMEEMKPLAQGLSLSQILYTLSVLEDVQSRMARTANRRTELEMAVVRVCNPAMDSSAEAVLTRLEELEVAVRRGVAAPAPTESSQADGEKPAPALPLAREPRRKKTPPPDIEPPLDLKTDPAPLAGSPGATPFLAWQEVLGRLLKTNPPLFAALQHSDAYEKDDLMLIDAKNELFFKLIRENEFAKDSLRDALMAQTGRRYRLGPYRAQEQPSVKAEEDPLDSLLTSAKNAGVAVEEK